jgi:hypothetical protein
MDSRNAKSAPQTGNAGADKVDAVVIEQVQRAVLADLRPVSVLASSGMLTLILMFFFAAAGSAVAWYLGLGGFEALQTYQRALIFPALAIASWLAAVACARGMLPASGMRPGPVALIFSMAALSFVFLMALHNYSTQDFVAEGVPCLLLGLRVAIPTGVGMVLILRRGFVLDWSSAGFAAGALSGLAGVVMLELHCPNPKVVHSMVWHVAVVVVSAVLGFVLGMIADRVRIRATV